MTGEPQPKVFVVDDTETNIDVLLATLGEQYDVSVAMDGESALEDIAAIRPDIILLDVMMPGIDGYEVCRQLKKEPATRDIPIIFVTARQDTEDETLGFRLGAVDYIGKPFSPPVVQARVRTHLQLLHARQQLAQQNEILEQRVLERTEQVRQKNEELASTRLEIIRRLGRAAEYKDNETGLHVIRMSHYARILAIRSGWSSEQAETLLQAAPMHDIGKIGIPDRILLKPGKLDEDEWRIMRQHPGIGAGIIGRHSSALLEMARVVALSHHEKWDGSGYPRGLKAEAIPLGARIVAVADVFDALTTERPYKQAWSVEQALAMLHKEAGHHFDPQLVPLFAANMDEVLAVRRKWQEGSEQSESLADIVR
ncbi:MAG: two-component system response regulator [Magnetococcales bacterium]|nr:two-component system response regulator [Magnetococcales bacterium]